MKKYNQTDYAINKKSPHIVYAYGDEIVEITIDDYLKQNPTKSEEDFKVLKELSDEIYHEQAVEENKNNRNTLQLDDYADNLLSSSKCVLQGMIDNDDLRKTRLATVELLNSGKLTDVQKDRFIKYYFQGISSREIAKKDCVNHKSVLESLNAANKKLKKYFKKF